MVFCNPLQLTTVYYCNSIGMCEKIIGKICSKSNYKKITSWNKKSAKSMKLSILTEQPRRKFRDIIEKPNASKANCYKTAIPKQAILTPSLSVHKR